MLAYPPTAHLPACPLATGFLAGHKPFRSLIHLHFNIPVNAR
jgi:hypothetical protein